MRKNTRKISVLYGNYIHVPLRLDEFRHKRYKEILLDLFFILSSSLFKLCGDDDGKKKLDSSFNVFSNYWNDNYVYSDDYIVHLHNYLVDHVKIFDLITNVSFDHNIIIICINNFEIFSLKENWNTLIQKDFIDFLSQDENIKFFINVCCNSEPVIKNIDSDIFYVNSSSKECGFKIDKKDKVINYKSSFSFHEENYSFSVYEQHLLQMKNQEETEVTEMDSIKKRSLYVDRIISSLMENIVLDRVSVPNASELKEDLMPMLADLRTNLKTYSEKEKRSKRYLGNPIVQGDLQVAQTNLESILVEFEDTWNTNFRKKITEDLDSIKEQVLGNKIDIKGEVTKEDFSDKINYLKTFLDTSIKVSELGDKYVKLFLPALSSLFSFIL